MEADLMVTCPYNPAHRIRKYKLMDHLTKCKKSSKVQVVEKKAVCPLDKSHIVDCDHLKGHVESCSSIGKLVDMQIKPADSKTNIEPPLVNKYMLTENWDEEPEVPAYNPMEVSAKKPVIRCVSGLTKSEKKKFRDNERMRIANLRGFHTASAASSSFTVKDTVNEVPLRPPRDPAESLCNTFVSQDDFNKSMEIHDQDAIMQANLVPESHHNSFHKMMYQALAPEENNTKQYEQSLRSTDMGIRHYLQHIKRENRNIPFSNQNQETKVKETEIDATCDLFNINDRIKNECISSISDVHSERVTDKLLALLKRENDSEIKKVQPVEETVDINQTNKDTGEIGPSWDEIFNKFNERLAYLTDIQNTAAEESALLLKQLKDLKLREEAALKK